jgi:hypothetical protein
VPELRRRRRRFADEQRLTHDWEIKDFAGEVVPPLGLRMLHVGDPDRPGGGHRLDAASIRDKEIDQLIYEATIQGGDQKPAEGG